MLAEWSVECAAEDPVLVVPWKDPDGRCMFVDLRADPYDFDLVPEAVHFPPLMQTLRALNAPRSPVFTAKCDAWEMAGEELTSVAKELDLEAADAATGFASYIDLVARDRLRFASLHQQEEMARRLARLAEAVKLETAKMECVVRPAVVDFEGAQQGYAITLYVKALGPDAATANERWAAALTEIVALIRSKNFAR